MINLLDNLSWLGIDNWKRTSLAQTYSGGTDLVLPVAFTQALAAADCPLKVPFPVVVGEGASALLVLVTALGAGGHVTLGAGHGVAEPPSDADYPAQTPVRVVLAAQYIKELQEAARDGFHAARAVLAYQNADSTVDADGNAILAMVSGPTSLALFNDSGKLGIRRGAALVRVNASDPVADPVTKLFGLPFDATYTLHSAEYPGAGKTAEVLVYIDEDRNVAFERGTPAPVGTARESLPQPGTPARLGLTLGSVQVTDAVGVVAI